MKTSAVWGMAGLALLVAGCLSVGPDYEQGEVRDPAHPLPDAGAVKGEDGNEVQVRAAISAEEIGAWWKVFHDPQLDELIARACTNSPSLRAGVARIRQARAQLAAARGRWEPTLDAAGGITRFRTSGNGQSGRRMTRNLFSGGFDASWELDLFGGVRRSVEAAEAELESSIAGWEQVWVIQAAEVANTYAALRTVQQRLVVARDNLKIQDETLQILTSRLESGIGDDLAVQQARYNVETTRATIPALLAQEESYLNALAVLVGVEPGSLQGTIKPAKQLTMDPRSLDVISAEYLRRRPDLRQAERALAAQCARIGVATAELYPHFRLNGSLGLESLKASDFFKSSSLYWSVGPSVSWSIFNGASVRANIELQKARFEEACANYDAAVLAAVRDIRNAISAYSQEYHRNLSLAKAVEAAHSAVNISQDLYKSGLRDFNNVLDAQRYLLSLQEAFTISQGNIATELIALYKALGGGWSCLEDNGK